MAIACINLRSFSEKVVFSPLLGDNLRETRVKNLWKVSKHIDIISYFAIFYACGPYITSRKLVVAY